MKVERRQSWLCLIVRNNARMMEPPLERVMESDSQTLERDSRFSMAIHTSFGRATRQYAFLRW